MDVQEKFDQLCQELGLSDSYKANAWAFWEYLAENQLEGDPVPWLICSVYTVVCKERSSFDKAAATQEVAGSPTITAMMKAGNMRLVDFFQRMKVVLNVCGPGSPVHDHVEKLKKKFCILAALIFNFKRTLPVFFQDEQSFCSSEHREEFVCLCWLLFIVCKGQHCVPFDLMTGFYLLLCCTDYVIRNIASSRNPALQQLRESTDVNILQHLCQDLGVPYSRVEQVNQQYWLPFLNGVAQDQKNKLLDVSYLYTMYGESSFSWSDIDERDFISSEPHLFVSDDRVQGTGSCACAYSEETSSYMADRELETRITHGAGMELQHVLEVASDSPSLALLTFWNNCRRKNPTKCILARLKDVQEQFLSCFSSAVGEQIGYRPIEIYTQGRRLYFRIMEAMLLAEEKRLSCSDFSALLNSDKFHLSLLGCSLEVAMAQRAILCPALSFPWILKVVRQMPYDFFKVIESFILHEPLLSSSVIKHLNRTEEQILESLAWKSVESRFFHRFGVNKSLATADIEGSPLLTDMEKHCVQSDSNSGSLLPQQSKRSQPLNLFIRKVNHLAHQRLTALCTSLGIQEDTELTDHMWTCLEQSLKMKWTLLMDRHLDQMILCAVYAISKIADKEIQFKQIVNDYRSLPNASSNVYKGAVISDTEQDTIIGFYNKVYMPTMRTLILRFAPHNKNPPASPRPTLNTSAHVMMRSPVKQIKNFYVSPMKISSSGMLTPKPRSLYSFGESPGSGDRDSLSRINASMKAVHAAQTSIPQKRLRFDECECQATSTHTGQEHSLQHLGSEDSSL